MKLRVPQEHIDEIIEEVETALDEIKKELQELTGEEE